MATPIRTPEAGVPAAPRPRRRRRRRAGPRWLDFSIGATALVVSAASLLVARHQGQVMDRQLAASVWPSVQSAYSDEGPNGERRIVLSLDNRGVGPARVQSFRVFYRGRAVRNRNDLGTACCRPDTSPGSAHPKITPYESYVAGRLFGAGEHVEWLTLRFDTLGTPVVRRATERAFEAIGRALPDITERVCYCSVLDECWVSSGDALEPARVASCTQESKALQYR